VPTGGIGPAIGVGVGVAAGLVVVGDGTGEGVCVGIGVGVNVATGVGVGVATGDGVRVGTGVGVGVATGVAVGVATGAGVGVAGAALARGVANGPGDEDPWQPVKPKATAQRKTVNETCLTGINRLVPALAENSAPRVTPPKKSMFTRPLPLRHASPNVRVALDATHG
jgi:hypothetical protein